jgi:cytochrome c oxidase assembly protein subunit 15
MSTEIKADFTKPVRIWLYCLAFLVFLMVLVGGATRLTDSGLSITEWKPVTGIIPPLSHEDWLLEMDKYRQIPEYQLINKGMNLEAFQTIYWWEWGHRFLGRLIGLTFLLPFLWFAFTKRISRAMMPRLFALFILGGVQGAIGWWMVASGLVDRVDVSQYRLAIHLTFACFIFAALLWVAHSFLPKSQSEDRLGRFKYLAVIFVCLVFLQIFLGGLVAGLDAGLSYTSWPLMDGAFIPSVAKLFVLSPWWINLGENTLTVQFLHRMNGYFLFCFGLMYFLLIWRKRPYSFAFRQSFILVCLLLGQMVLGILTLLFQVPLHLALLHQAGAVVLLGYVVWHSADAYTSNCFVSKY